VAVPARPAYHLRTFSAKLFSEVKMKFPNRRLALPLLALILLFAAADPASAQTAVQTQTVGVPGLKRPVTVRRDDRGIPYVEAENEEDLYFMQGYVTAQDRLWQMELLRRTARGELAEIFGRAALEEDKRHRTLGFARVVEGVAPAMSPQARAAVDAYARGVNAYIDSLDAKSLPPEFQILGIRPRPWTAADSSVVGKNFAEALSTTWRIDLMRAAFSDLPAQKLKELFPVTSPLDVLVVGTDSKKEVSESETMRTRTEVLANSLALLRSLSEDEAVARRSQERAGLYAEDLAASNNWVVSGKHTVTGKPLLANDPHLAPSTPSIWYMVHLSAPNLRVAGVTAAGAPGVIIGHNERVAWGVTNLSPDVQDLYREKFDTANPRRYMTPQGWREAEVRTEQIKVRKGVADASTETVDHEVVTTRNGPIVFEQKGARYALRWTALDARASEFDAFQSINRARNWSEFRAALEKYNGPVQNFVYADTDGHIGYYGAGKIPVRRTGDGSLPYDGATDEGEWVGMIPFAELPHLFDPPSGVIVTANSRVAGTSYPHHLTNAWAPPTRSRRILDMLSAKQKLTIDDFRAIQGDTFTISGSNFARQAASIARASGLDKRDAKWGETVKLFEGWDGRLQTDSRAALLANEMRAVFFLKILEGALGPERAKEYRWSNSATLFDRIITERPAAWLPAGHKSYGELLDAAHAEARAALAKRHGPDETLWTWGKQFRAQFPHPLASVPFVGGQFTVAPFPQSGSGGSFASVNVGSGVSMRLIADPSGWDRTQQGIAPGESGLPSSPHFKDQLADWQNVTPRAFPFTGAAVKAAAKETRVYRPAGN
jgi:penicillin amidase